MEKLRLTFLKDLAELFELFKSQFVLEQLWSVVTTLLIRESLTGTTILKLCLSRLLGFSGLKYFHV
jgi:hypothetical protein